MKLANRSLILLLIAILVVGYCATVSISTRREQASKLSASPSEQATERLEQSRMYESLQEAVAAARYKVYADERAGQAFYANNSKQNLSAQFTQDAARITADVNKDSDVSLPGQIKQAMAETPLHKERSINLRFIGAGYDNAIHTAVGQPIITTAGNRLTYRHELSTINESAHRLHSMLTASAIHTRHARWFADPVRFTIEEWYVNKPEGIEHGFTLNEPFVERREGERLRLEVEVEGDFFAQVFEEGKRIDFKSKDGRAKLSYAGLKAYDSLGRELAARMSVNETVLSYEVDDSTAVYPLTIDPTFTQQQKLVPGVSATDSFGSDVAISGDTAVVSAPYDDIGANAYQGSVFVFVRLGTTWSQQAKLTASDGAAEDFFGGSVAISLNTIVVGATGDDVGSNLDQGSAYVFVRSGTNWSQQAKLTAPDGAAGDRLGSEVAIDGDYAAITASRDADTGTGVTGTVRIFHRVGASWTNESTVTGYPLRSYNDLFGYSVAISGDTLIVGQPRYSNGFEIGGAQIFVRSGTNWDRQTKIPGHGVYVNGGGDSGWSVAISGSTVY